MKNQNDSMKQISLYPLKFEPICQYKLWGGRRLGGFLNTPIIDEGPIGEAWLLSDRDDFSNCVANGPLKGQTLKQLIKDYPQQLMGKSAGQYQRFPLILKFLDAHEMLSIQLHPNDEKAEDLQASAHGKTEGWIVLETGLAGCIFAGVKSDTTKEDLRQALENKTVEKHLNSFKPKQGDAVFIPAGTVHSFGDLVVFEIQENSDTTFRLYDWERIDAKTGLPRALQVEQALACLDLKQDKAGLQEPVLETATPILRERLFDCEYFKLWRIKGESPFTVGAAGELRVLVCIDGKGQVDTGDTLYRVEKGEVILLAAILGVCVFHPLGEATILEIADSTILKFSEYGG